MGQKVNPVGFRVGVINDWDSKWYASKKDFGDTLVEDYNLRKYLKELLYAAGVSKITIERQAGVDATSQGLKINIHCAKPGIVIGRAGSEIEKLKANVTKMVGKQVSINIVEIKRPETNAQLVAESIASALERRVGFRRAMKQAIERAMKLGVKGIKTTASGRLGGAEIARSEHYHEGSIPLQTLRADIDYGFAEAHTTYGKLGIKVWIYKGEVLPDSKRGDARPEPAAPAPERRERRDRRDRRGGDRRDNNSQRGGNR